MNMKLMLLMLVFMLVFSMNFTHAALAIDSSNSVQTAGPATTISTYLSTTANNDILIAYGYDGDTTFNSAFQITDTSSLTWKFRNFIAATGNAHAEYEFWALANTPITNDQITFSAASSALGIGVIAVSGGNTITPFDSDMPYNAVNGGSISSLYAIASTANANDMLIGSILIQNTGLTLTYSPTGSTAQQNNQQWNELGIWNTILTSTISSQNAGASWGTAISGAVTIVDAVQENQASGPLQTGLSISPSNSISYGTTPTLTATCLPNTDTCSIDAPLGTHLCTGTGTCTYTPPVLAVGSYTYYANDITSSTTTSNVLVINKIEPILALPSFPTNFIYNGIATTITANVQTLFNQVTANVYINGAYNSQTTTQTSFTELYKGTYPIIFNSVATANYLANSIANTLQIYPLNVTVTRQQQIMLYGTSDLVTATSNDSNENVYLYLNNVIVANGFGSTSYNMINEQIAGIWNVSANVPSLPALAGNAFYTTNIVADVNPPVQIANFTGINYTQTSPTQLFYVNTNKYQLLENSNFNNMVWFLANSLQLKSTLTTNALLSATTTTYNVILPTNNLNTSIVFLGFAYTNTISYSNPAFAANFTVNTLAPLGKYANNYVANPIYNINAPTIMTGNTPTLYGAYNPINSILPSIYYNDKFSAIYPNGTVAFTLSHLGKFSTNANVLQLNNFTLIANDTHTYQTNTLTNFDVMPELLYGNDNTVLPSIYTNTVTSFTTTNTVHALNFFFVNLTSNKVITGNVANIISQMAGFINLTANNSASQYYNGHLINGTLLGFNNFVASFNAKDVYQIDKFCANSLITQNLNLLNGQLQYESTANIISYFTFSNTHFLCNQSAINETLYIQTNATNVGQFNFYVQQGISQVAAVLQIYEYNINTNKYQLLDYITSPQQGTTVTLELPNNKPYSINIYQPNTNKLLGTVQTSLTCASNSICTFPLVIQNITISPFKSASNILYSCTYSSNTLTFTCTATDPTSTAQGYQLIMQQQGPLSTFTSCNQTSIGTYGTLTCSNVNASKNSYQYFLYVNYPFTKYVLTSGTLGNLSSNQFGTTGIIIAFLVLFVLSFMAMWNPQFVIVMDILGVFVTMLLQVWVVSAALFVQLLIIGILYIYKLRQ